MPTFNNSPEVIAAIMAKFPVTLEEAARETLVLVEDFRESQAEFYGVVPGEEKSIEELLTNREFLALALESHTRMLSDYVRECQKMMADHNYLGERVESLR